MIAIQEKTIGEIAAESPSAIAVFERFGIDYCCGGRRPLADACKDAGITVGEFESALNAAPAAPELNLDWTTRSLTDLHAYLVGRYHVHAREQLATLGTLAAKVQSVHGERHPEVRRVATLVTALEQDMLPHMTKEEIVLFPYVDSLETAEPQACCFGTVENPIRVMLAEHEAVGDILKDLRNTTGDYTPPEDACFSYRELYRRLAEMERETHEHIHLENNVYFPRAWELERSR
jgi:regulator of cell morphogenesis and NO signaling